ncbi:uncharacterized protein LOC111263945 [Varroa jacobsoni]|uniref:Transposase n=1 Tax=Varroa destructor TaxID=109461 RepID=A0A7M7JZT3_VARDE|nr:uncharacterized protein LOC111249165 [Varroa destructor]XP_022695212.1 uncharacterized protein LOC111263945 [Varroa jacobsoni]
MPLVPIGDSRNRPRTRSLAASAERFRPSLRYLLSAWHLNQRVDNSPFSSLQEQELCKIAHAKAEGGTQLSQSAFCVLVYRFAVRFNRASTGHLQAWRNSGGRAGKKWLKGFLARYPELRNAFVNETTASVSASLLELPSNLASSQRSRKQKSNAGLASSNDHKENKGAHPQSAGKKVVTISYHSKKIGTNPARQQRDQISKQSNVRQVVIETLVR